MPKGVGRTEEEVKELVQIIEELMQDGVSLNMACAVSKIPRQTIYNYIDKYEWVSTRITAAEEYLKVQSERNIAAAVKGGDLDTSKWYAERRMKDKYSTKEVKENQGAIVELHTNADFKQDEA